jgi:hypothetical protein
MYPARFAHHSLDAFGVILEALRLGDAIARELPRGYGKLSDQLRRALLGAYLQFTEAAAREGADRSNRLRCARAEAGESAAALEAAELAQPPSPLTLARVRSTFAEGESGEARRSAPRGCEAPHQTTDR